MKTMKLFSMAAVALLMAACSNSDDFDVQKPAETAGVYHFEATIAAPDADATMRTVYTEVTESTDPDYKKIKVAWKVGDKIALVHNGVVDEAEVKTVDNVTGKATIEADFTVSPSNNDDVYLAYPADAVADATTPYPPFPFTPSLDIFNKVRNQNGTLAYIQDNLDLRMGSGKLAVSGSDVTLKESVSIPSLICIWKLTLQDNAATPSDLNATQLTFINNNSIQARATSTGKSEYYLCVVPRFNSDASGTFSFKATVGSDTYTFSTTGLSLTDGNYYQSTLTMAKLADLSTISSNYEAKDGEILTGTLASNVKISIADGATVTLKDVNINGSSGSYAGITCAGNATINLEGTNTVKGFSLNNPGIYVPDGKTLTIQGSGSLDATGRNNAAGIGGGQSGSCGNIVINGGNITATGGANGAGIGGGKSGSYGTIEISGGTVNATGGMMAAGIGGGFMNGTCGTITITSGVTKVTATKGTDAPNSIGSGKNGTAISVTIGGTVYASGISQSPYEYPLPTLSLTSPTVGQVIGSDGKNYAAGSVPTGVTAVAMIAYVSGAHGLAIALADESGYMNWATAKSTCEAKTPAFTGGTWKLPSLDEWKNMLTYDGDLDFYLNNNLQTALSTAGGTSLQDWMYYWSLTDYDSDNTQACDVKFQSGEANFSHESKTYTSGMLVRAVLAF